MKVVLSHPTGNEFVRAAILGLHEAGLLSEFRTSVAAFPGSLLDKLGGVSVFSDFRRRRYPSQLRNLTYQWPWYELSRQLALKVGINELTEHETGVFCVDKVYRNLDRHVSENLRRISERGASSVYSYEDGAELTFQEAKRLKLKCIYDLPIGYWRTARRLMENEYLLNPDWASTLIGFQDSDTKLERKDEELKLADHIIVASHFTANTLKDFPGSLAPIDVIPYGFPPIARGRVFSTVTNNRPLKLLFVGSLSQRKGIASLFTAAEALGPYIELTVVGQKINNSCSALNAALAKHRWIPSLPHAEILALMQKSDVLVFPSLFEGFGLVITEAMSQGTPVITTDRTAGPDLIEHNLNGWIVEAGSSQAIQIALEDLIRSPRLITEAGKAAMETASSRPWKVYGQELADTLVKYV